MSNDGAEVGAGVALVIRTWGSTGRPKGVELTHAALHASARASLQRLAAAPGERWLSCLSPDHIAGMQVLVRSMVGGSEPVIHERFEVASFARERRAAFVSLVPTMLGRLLDARVDLSGWRAILLGGGPADGSLRARARADGAPVVTTYGMTETCGGVVYDGRPLDDVEIAIGGRGRISIRGPMLMSGYRLRPDRTSAALADGWFQTSDRGRLLADGSLQVVGRLDDVIISGAEKIDPSEVASLLEEHPSVEHAFVYGRPDRQWGERVVAAIVPAPGTEPSLDELRDFATAHAAAYKAPREIVIVRHPPNATPTGC